MRAQEIELIALHEPALQPIPFAQVERRRQRFGRLGLDQGVRADGEQIVRLRRVEMIDGVAESVGIGEQLGDRLEFELETDQALARALLRLHPQLHDALAHRSGVAVLGHVADFEQHDLV
jgi:hypothetical protein